MFEGFLARALYAVKRETAAAIFIQKHVRRWLLRHAYVELYSAVVTLQSNIRGFSTRQRFVHGKKHKAATLIQVNKSPVLYVACASMRKIYSKQCHYL